MQVCLAALMAQVGAWVPAQSLTLTPVDAIFVRMGAKDDVMSGQSTFFVELAETAAALNRATPASLVALDELGRGTATSDGAAIASAVLEHLSAKTCCRCSLAICFTHSSIHSFIHSTCVFPEGQVCTVLHIECIPVIFPVLAAGTPTITMLRQLTTPVSSQAARCCCCLSALKYCPMCNVHKQPVEAVDALQAMRSSLMPPVTKPNLASCRMDAALLLLYSPALSVDCKKSHDFCCC